jgi:glycerol-3-phosphate dehydrogenase subunit C
MSAPYDPDDALYLDEADVRLEIARSFNVCRDCRQCVDLCLVFPSAFSVIDQLSSFDAAMMTPHQQDQLVEACHECTLCTAKCPYGPGSDSIVGSDALDVWALMVRAKRMRRHHGLLPIAQRVREWLGAWGAKR